MRWWVEKNVFLDSVCPVSLITKVWSQNSWHLPFIGEKLIISGLTGNAWAERKSDNVIVFYASISPQIIFWAILFLPVWLFFGLFPIFPDTSGHSALSKPQRSCRTIWDNKGHFLAPTNDWYKRQPPPLLWSAKKFTKKLRPIVQFFCRDYVQ